MSAVELLLKKEEKKPEKPAKPPIKEEPEYKVVLATLKRITEQLENRPSEELLQEVRLLLGNVKEQQDLIITLLRKKVDLDVKEEEVMDLLMAKMKKG